MSEERFQGVTTRQLCYLLKDAKKFTADEYPEWRQEAAQQDVVAIEAECVRRDAELAQLRAELALLRPLAEAAQWVPVTEALPGERNPDEGIVALLENGVRVDAMHGKEGWFQWDYELSDWLPLVGVTHWYRVPPPPTK